MSDHLIILDKQPGVCPVVVGENWRHLFAKCVIRVTGLKSTNMCQHDQLFDGLKAGTGGYVHRVQNIWDTKLTMKDWGFLLIYSQNTINKINHI